MTKKNDLTGHRYGRLTVLHEAAQIKKERRWLCKCDCGKEKVVRMNQLRSGKTKSCGCLQRERTSKNNITDLTGKRFGKLTVINRSNKLDSRKRVYWTCQCDCGKTVEVLTTSLTKGLSKSCGCRRSEAGHSTKKHHEEQYRKDGVMTTTLRRKKNINNVTGVKGVSQYRTKTGIKYRVFIGVKNKNIYLGTFNTIDEAKQARKKAEELYHKPYLEDDSDEQR